MKIGRSRRVANPRKSPEPPASRTRPRRAWRRWLLIGALAVVAAGAWLDHRGAAMIARQIVLREAAAAGLRGDVAFTGTLRDGLTLQSLRLRGDGPVREVEIDRLRAEWDWQELVSGKVRAFDGERLRVVIATDSGGQASESSGEPSEGGSGENQTNGADDMADDLSSPLPMDTIRSLWAEYARGVAMEWRGIEVSVLSGENELITLDASTLRHRPGEDALHLQLGEVRARGFRTGPQEIHLGLTESGFTLDQLVLPGGVGLRAVRADARAWRLESEITHESSVARLRMDRDTIDLALDAGAIDLRAAVSPWVPWPETAAGTMDACTVSIEEWRKGPLGWRAGVESRFSGLAYDRWVVPMVEVKARWEDRAIEVQANGEAGHSPFVLTGTLNHDNLAFSGGRAEAEISTSGIGDLFATARDRFLPDARGLPVPEGEMQARFSGAWGEGSWKNFRGEARSKAWKLGDRLLPDVAAECTWDSPRHPMVIELRAAEKEGGKWIAKATWDMAAMAYTGEASSGGAVDARPWFDFASCFARLPARALPVFALEWKGGGRVNVREHKGEFVLDVPALGLEPLPGASLNARGCYDWPRSIDGVAIELRNGGDHVAGQLAYDGKSIGVEKLEWRQGEESIATASAAIPWTPATRNTREFLDLEEPMRAELKIGKRPLAFWENFFPPDRRPPPLRGSVEFLLAIAGSPARPEIDLQLTGQDLGWIHQPEFSPASLVIRAAAKGGKAEVVARAEHAEIEPITVDLQLPFDPPTWLANPREMQSLPVTGSARMKDLRLERYAPLLPALRQVGGRVDIDLALAGSIANPDILGRASLSGGVLAMKNPSVGHLENAELVLDFKHDRLTLSKGQARLGGGEVSITGDGMIQNGAIPYTFRAKGDHLLLWRDDSMIVRGSPDLQITGDGKNWKLAGSVAVVESIFARDVDFLPIGRSFTVPSAPSLPAFSAPPAPPADSKLGALALDVLVEMKDPLLIRGNVARGQVTGTARVRGTAAAPEVDGGFVLTDGVARLPLSVLRIPRGEAIFLPGRGLVPEIRATGRSKIPPYEVNVNVSGPVNNVQVHLSSEPPLPSNEVLALLATGSTTGALEDPANAQAKAAQLLVQELRNGRLPFGRRIAALLGPLEDVQVQVGQESPFDGRARNGVTIEMTDRFLLTGAVDAEGNQRLTLTVLFRFR